MADISPYKEDRFYEENKCWNVYQWKKVGLDTSVGMHYNNSIEFNFFHNVVADAYIGGKHYTFKDDCVVLIMPNVIHSFTYTQSEGTLTNVNINHIDLKPIFDIDAFWSHSDIQVQKLPTFIPANDTSNEILHEFLSINSFDDFLIAFMKLLRIIKIETKKEAGNFEIDASHNDFLRSVLTWTKQNLTRKFSVDEIAQAMGYNKSYFCRKFKNSTEMTYTSFVNYLKICTAHRFLKQGCSVSQACDQCGFEDTSYFISLFKKQYGLTPKKFIDNLHEKSNPGE